MHARLARELALTLQRQHAEKDGIILGLPAHRWSGVDKPMRSGTKRSITGTPSCIGMTWPSIGCSLHPGDMDRHTAITWSAATAAGVSG